MNASSKTVGSLLVIIGSLSWTGCLETGERSVQVLPVNSRTIALIDSDTGRYRLDEVDALEFNPVSHGDFGDVVENVAVIREFDLVNRSNQPLVFHFPARSNDGGGNVNGGSSVVGEGEYLDPTPFRLLWSDCVLNERMSRFSTFEIDRILGLAEGDEIRTIEPGEHCRIAVTLNPFTTFFREPRSIETDLDFIAWPTTIGLRGSRVPFSAQIALSGEVTDEECGLSCALYGNYLADFGDSFAPSEDRIVELPSWQQKVDIAPNSSRMIQVQNFQEQTITLVSWSLSRADYTPSRSADELELTLDPDQYPFPQACEEGQTLTPGQHCILVVSTGEVENPVNESTWDLVVNYAFDAETFFYPIRLFARLDRLRSEANRQSDRRQPLGLLAPAFRGEGFHSQFLRVRPARSVWEAPSPDEYFTSDDTFGPRQFFYCQSDADAGPFDQCESVSNDPIFNRLRSTSSVREFVRSSGQIIYPAFAVDTQPDGSRAWVIYDGTDRLLSLLWRNSAGRWWAGSNRIEEIREFIGGDFYLQRVSFETDAAINPIDSSTFEVPIQLTYGNQRIVTDERFASTTLRFAEELAVVNEFSNGFGNREAQTISFDFSEPVLQVEEPPAGEDPPAEE
jgi:hypothetical protein